MSGTRKRVRDVLMEEGIETKHLKVYFNTHQKNPPKNSEKESKETLENVILKYDKEPKKESCNSPCKECQQKFDELNRKFDSMITLQAKLISLLEDIDYRFNDKGQMLSYIS